MGKVSSARKSVKAATKVEPKVELPKELEVVYPNLIFTEYSVNSEQGPLTPEDIEDMFGWETEPKYVERMMEKYPNTKPSDHFFYEDYHCINTNKEKVRCHNNAGNRPFDMDWCEDLIRMILRGEWAGPLTIPGETINGETFRMSKYGRVLSGQHQGTALVLANERLQQSRDVNHRPHYDPNDPDSELYPFWRDHDYCVIETLVVTGLSEDERVLRTIDYVKERTLADVLYTMELYRKNNPPERKEMTRMLAAAIDLLWTRTCAQGYRTHPEMVAFLNRHETLLDCVEHLFLENKPIVVDKKRREGESEDEHKIRLAMEAVQGGRRISKLHLSPGQCAALCYLMGTSATSESDSETYRGDGRTPPTEKLVDFSMMERAKLFWTKLAGDKEFVPVRVKLNSLITSEADSTHNLGLGGRWEEKLAVLAKAWGIFKDHYDDPFPYEVDPVTNVIDSDDLKPNGGLWLYYSKLGSDSKPLPPGMVQLIDIADFKGIDVPKEGSKSQSKREAPSAKPTPEEIEEQKERINEDKDKKEQAKKEAPKKPVRRIVRK